MEVLRARKTEEPEEVPKDSSSEVDPFYSVVLLPVANYLSTDMYLLLRSSF